MVLMLEPGPHNQLFAFTWSYAVGITISSEVYANSDVRSYLDLYREHASSFEERFEWNRDGTLGDRDPTVIAEPGLEQFSQPDVPDSCWLDRELAFMIATRKRSQLEQQLGTTYMVSLSYPKHELAFIGSIYPEYSSLATVPTTIGLYPL